MSTTAASEVQIKLAFQHDRTANPYGDLDRLLIAELGRTRAEVTRELAISAKQRIIDGAEQTTGEVLSRGNSSNPQFADLKQETRAQKAGIGGRTQEKLDHLARLEDRTLYNAVCAGRISVNRAAIEAGFVKPTATIRTDDVHHAAEVLAKHFDIHNIQQMFGR